MINKMLELSTLNKKGAVFDSVRVNWYIHLQFKKKHLKYSKYYIFILRYQVIKWNLW